MWTPNPVPAPEFEPVPVPDLSPVYETVNSLVAWVEGLKITLPAIDTAPFVQSILAIPQEIAQGFVNPLVEGFKGLATDIGTALKENWDTAKIWSANLGTSMQQAEYEAADMQ